MEIKQVNDSDTVKIDAKGLHYRKLNEYLHQAVNQGCQELELVNVNGQRYIGTGLIGDPTIKIYGTPGSDLAAFMDGPRLEVFGSAQDAVGNTMNAGRITIHGDGGNVLGLSMRGGDIYVRKSVGYRVGIHVKAFGDQFPRIVIGGTAGHFLGEYMAGGRIIVLGLDRHRGEPLAGDYLGTGMHGGTIYIRGDVNPEQLGKEVQICQMGELDFKILDQDLRYFCQVFDADKKAVLKGPFVKLQSVSHRPYGQLYAY